MFSKKNTKIIILFSFIFSMFFCFNCLAITQEEILCYYNMDEYPLTEEYDEEKDLTCYQNFLPYETVSVWGYSYAFLGTGGTDDDLACFSDPLASFNPSNNAFSISVWFQATTSPETWYTLTSLSGEWASAGVNGQIQTDIDGKIYFAFKNTDDNWINLSSDYAQNIYDGQWHNYYFEGEYNNMINTGKLFLDNNELYTSWNTPNWANSDPKIASSSPVRLGIGTGYNTVNNTYVASGRIDEVYWFDKMLSETERTQLFYSNTTTYDDEIIPIYPLEGDTIVGYSQVNINGYYTNDLGDELCVEVDEKEYFTTVYEHCFDIIGTSTLSSFSDIVSVIDGEYLWFAVLYAHDPYKRIVANTGAINFSADFLGVASTTFEMPLGLGDEDLCFGIATSTFYGAIECGLKKVVYWSFYPSQNALSSLSSRYTQLKNSFPFNAYFGLTNIVDEAIATSTTDMSGSFDLPFIDKNGDYTMIPVLGSSSITNMIGDDNNSLFRNSITWLLWSLAGLIVFITFKKI